MVITVTKYMVINTMERLLLHLLFDLYRYIDMSSNGGVHDQWL